MPRGERSKLGKTKKARRNRPRYAYFPIGKLPRGRYWVTAEVRDKTPWVVKDEKRLLVERATWYVRVTDS